MKPFLKWAGGKHKLLPYISQYYPFEYRTITKYAEPFVGGGAVLFDILNNFTLEHIYISDINPQLINTYQCIKSNVHDVIELLLLFQNRYWQSELEAQLEMFNSIRNHYNLIGKHFTIHNTSITRFHITLAAMFIFLNKTCFNGLYRVNSKGEFNVPMRRYKHPLICDVTNLINASNLLHNVYMQQADYRAVYNFADHNTFIYFDPPYRPITKTASFTAYTKKGFDDYAQIELSQFIKRLSDKGVYILLSNSDPKSTDERDSFFDDLYSDFTITRIQANRAINSNGLKRGPVSELLIHNVT